MRARLTLAVVRYQLCGIGGLVSWILECQYGFGRHQNSISRANWVKLLEAQFFQSVIEASFAFGFLKISIALSLLRLSRGNWYNRILWGLIGIYFTTLLRLAFTDDTPTGFICFYTLFSFITFLTYCKPISGQWNAELRPKCYSRSLYRDFGLFNSGESNSLLTWMLRLTLCISACNIFTDITFASLPIPLIWSLQLQRRIRLYLIIILSGGYCAVRNPNGSRAIRPVTIGTLGCSRDCKGDFCRCLRSRDRWDIVSCPLTPEWHLRLTCTQFPIRAILRLVGLPRRLRLI